MAFELNLSSCQSGNCQHLILTDISADTTVTPNTTWNTPPNPNMADISSATLTITVSSYPSASYVLNVTGFFVWEYIGRASCPLGGTIITGTGTSFTTTVTPGDHIQFSGMSVPYLVTSVVSDTELIISAGLIASISNEWLFDINVHVSNPANLVFDIIPSDLGLSSTTNFNDDVYNIVYSVTDTITNTTYQYQTNILLYCNIECCVYNKVQSIPQYYECNTCNSVHINDALTCWGLLMGLESAARCGSSNALLNTLNLLKKLCHHKPCQGCK